MRHDPRYSQSHYSAVRQKTQQYPDDNRYSNTFYHYKQGYKKYEPDEHFDRSRGYSTDGAITSALSGATHAAEKQWEWLESVLEKSKRNKETVSIF